MYAALRRERNEVCRGGQRSRLDTALVSVHHPRGVRQAISFGTLEELLHWEAMAYCGEDAQPDEVHYPHIRWDEGVFDSGSSGSGMFLRRANWWA